MLSKLRKIRHEKGLTQQQLAKLAGVKQSLISRIESGKTDTSYSKAQKILAALESKPKALARDIMIKRIYTIFFDDKIRKAASIMKRRNISQLPVIKDEKIVGAVSESAITLKKANAEHVSDIIEPSLPTIDQNTSIDVARDLLRHAQAVIITNRGKPVGIIAKTDLLKFI